jgi:hypothetical protein
MSVTNVQFEMQNTQFPATSTTPVVIAHIADATYGKLGILGYVTGTVAVSLALTASGGYVGRFAKGCVMIETATGYIYQNKAAASVPSFALNAS